MPTYFMKLQHFDPSPLIEKMRKKHELKIVSNAIVKMFPNESICAKDMTVAMERVEYYSQEVYTIRYKGIVVMRRFIEDIFTTKYRYESPLFDQQSTNQ